MIYEIRHCNSMHLDTFQSKRQNSWSVLKLPNIELILLHDYVILKFISYNEKFCLIV